MRVARDKPGRRCPIEYDAQLEGLHDPPTSFTVLGKANAWEFDSATGGLLHALRKAGFGLPSEDGVFVPEPLGMTCASSDLHEWSALLLCQP